MAMRFTYVSFILQGVNNGQAIKSEAVYYRHSRDTTDVTSTELRMWKIDTYHGQASGIFSIFQTL